MTEIVVATHNKGKLREFQDLLGNRYRLLSVGDFDGGVEPEENGKTFAENALIKARAAYKASGLPSFADDSGICVDALDGAPGIYSARYAEGGPKACNAKLLEVMKDVSDEKRTAHFACCIAYTDGKKEFTVEGRCEGYILREEDGKEGFGYDPLFYSKDIGKSFGKATLEEKTSCSHRGRAALLFAEKLKEIYGE